MLEHGATRSSTPFPRVFFFSTLKFFFFFSKVLDFLMPSQNPDTVFIITLSYPTSKVLFDLHLSIYNNSNFV